MSYSTRKPKPPCSADGCDSFAAARGMCRNHYAQWHYSNRPPKPQRIADCVVCGRSFSPVGPQTICGDECRRKHNAAQQREWYRRNGRPPKDRSKMPTFEVVCAACGDVHVTKVETTKYCPACRGVAGGAAYRAKKAAARSHLLPVLHPNPDPPTSSPLPRDHPARRKSWRRRIMAKPPKHPNTGWSFFVQGACRWCSESFTAVGTDPNPEMIAKYCSTACAVSQHRHDKGRFVIPKQVRLAIYERDGWTCQLCTEPVDRNLPTSDVWAATLDHIVCQSWSDEPDHSPENLRLAHRWCNSVRGDESHFDESFFAVA